MKIKSLILGMLSFAAVVACTQEQVVAPKLDVDKTEVSVEAVAGEATINVTSNVEWKASSKADWVSFNPSSGKGADKAVAVKITAEDNSSEEARTATVIIEAGDLQKTVKVSQAGKSKEPEPGPEPEPEPEYNLDGKQWVFTWNGLGMPLEAVADLGVTQEGTIILAVDGSAMGMAGYVPYISGTYEVKPTDGTSGVVEFVDPTDPTATQVAISYKNLTETTVKFTLEALGMVDVEAVAAAEKIEIGTAEPEPEPEPEPTVSEWSLVGSFNNWTPSAGLDLVEFDTEYYVYKGFAMESSTEFKFVKNKQWGGDMGGNGRIEPNTIQPTGGSNISVTEPGTYDVFLAKSLDKFYVMTPGKTPAEAVEPTPVDPSTFTWGMMGCFVDNQWTSDVPMTKEGEWLVAKNAQFTELTFKIRANESWADATNIGFAPGSEKGETNKAVTVVTAEYSKANLGGDAADIKLNGEAGVYDVYFNYDKLELWVMTAGMKPGEEPVEKPYTVVAEGVMEANEIISYNESCLLVRGKDLKIYRMAYDSATGTFASAELKADWSSYVTLWLAKGPGNYLHFGNMYDTWAVYNCGDDASVLPAWDGICDGVNEGVIVGAASTYWPVRTGHPTGILGFLGDGRLLYYGLDEKARLLKQADGVTNVYAYTEGFNFAAYSGKSFCYGYDLICVDTDGNMWLHTWDAATLTYSTAPTQIGSGWGKFTHLIPWGKDLLARDEAGTLYRYAFNLDNFWEVE